MTADELRALRQRLGMTRKQLAKALDLTIDTINNYEGARGPYPIPRVVAMACMELLTCFGMRQQKNSATPARKEITK